VIAVERSHLNVAAISHPGMTGKNNEDRYAVSAYRLDQEASIPAAFAIVADGIGGHRAGEVAAELAVETISNRVADSDASHPLQTLHEAIIRAGQLINEKSEENPEQKGMGSTCACAWIIGSRLYIATVGDSRIYLLRAGAIHQLTTDHTWVQEAIDQGTLKPDQARNHPNAHVIRRYLGSRNDVVPDLRLRLQREDSDADALEQQGASLLPGDMLLLCSDGLTDLVEDSEILESIQTRGPQEALQELVRLANRRGGHDNITIVLLGVPAIDRATIPVIVRKKRSRLLWVAAVFGTLAALGLLVGAGFVWMWIQSEPAIRATERPFEQQRATLFPSFERTLAPTLTRGAAPAGANPQPGGTPSASPTLRITPLPGRGSPEPSLTPWPTNAP
jgi:protein phosphatase